MDEFPAGICNNLSQTIPRQQDADIFYIHCTGGFKSAQRDDDLWQIEPVFEEGEARAKGFLSRSELDRLIALSGYKVLGFQSAGWLNGQWHSSWRPIIPGQRNHAHSPSDIWNRMSNNLLQASRIERLDALEEADNFKIGEILDDRSTAGRLTQSISLSLRSMDLAVEQIADHYNEQLVNRMLSGQVDGQRGANTLDQNLFANVHSFFLQLGSARDYLAALIADRLGMDAGHGKTDTMNALKSKIRTHHIGSDTLLDLVVTKNWLVKSPGEKDRWATSGWLKEVTELRNEIVHRRPYGLKHVERFGWASPVLKELGLFRYVRPIALAESSESDLLDIVRRHYQTCTGFFFEAAQASGLDGSMITLNAKDIQSLKINPSSEKNP